MGKTGGGTLFDRPAWQFDYAFRDAERMYTGSERKVYTDPKPPRLLEYTLIMTV